MAKRQPGGAAAAGTAIDQTSAGVAQNTTLSGTAGPTPAQVAAAAASSKNAAVASQSYSPAQLATTRTGGGSTVNPNAQPGGAPVDYSQYGAAGGPNYAADLAEKKREFDITTARDIAKQNGTEVDALQARLAALSGPKDAYADYFFSHGLLPPQGYKPAPVPLTQAQIAAYGNMGVTPQQLQAMIAGTGQPGADTGMLGSLGSSLQTPAGLPQFQKAPDMIGAQTPSNPTVQGGALDGKNPTVPGTGGTPTVTPGGVPSMAGGGQVPGPPGTPSLAVVHGGEQVTPADGQMPPQMPQAGGQQGGGGSLLSNPGLHPAIAQLVDAVSQLLSNPDFRPFVAAAQDTTQATSGGVPSMALGGTVPGGPDPSAGPGSAAATPSSGAVPSGAAPSPPSNTPSATSSFGGGNGPTGMPSMMGRGGAQASAAPTSGAPVGGAQGVISNTGPAPVDSPVMPISNMDPYTRALYDIHGRLHPYSAQQEQQMGPQGLAAVSSYVGKVQGGDVGAYQDLANRLKPQNGAPTGSNTSASEGFSFG